MIHFVLKPLLTLALIAAILPLTNNNSFATTRIVSVQNYIFTPQTLNASVGDTIKFQWVNGNHTTTCNGSLGTTLPPGATPWNAVIDANNQQYSTVLTAPGLYTYASTPSGTSMIGTILTTVTGVNPLSSNIPDKFSLMQNYPNPFNPETNISFDIAKSGFVKLTVFDLSGRTVSSLVNENLTAGSYSVSFNASNYGSGVYLYRLESETYSEIKKMTLIK